MRHLTLLIAALVTTGCASTVTTPRLPTAQPCPPILEAPAGPTLADLRQFALDLQRQGGECRDRHQALIDANGSVR